jgi:hypothetical protein
LHKHWTCLGGTLSALRFSTEIFAHFTHLAQSLT